MKILFLTDERVDTIEQKLSGVYSAAKALGWSVQDVEMRRTARTFDDFMSFFEPDGCIVDCDTELAKVEPGRYPSVPFVYLDCDDQLTPRTAHTVRNDSASCVDIAFRELSRINPKSWVFVPWCTPVDWSLERQERFSELAERIGVDYAVFSSGWSREDMLKAQSDISAFLSARNRPCAVLAANDEIADLVVRSVRHGGLSMPGDYALVGIDNSERLCENIQPSITSVQPDFFAGGELSIRVLDDVISGRCSGRVQRIYAPKDIVRRQSARRLLVNDPAVEKAVELIRLRACEGLKASEVVAGICSVRRAAERRFRRATGKSILEEILDCRFQRVLEMLANPNQMLAPIANMCGWESDTYLKRYFKKRTGMSMSEWRRRALARPQR